VVELIANVEEVIARSHGACCVCIELKYVTQRKNDEQTKKNKIIQLNIFSIAETKISNTGKPTAGSVHRL
jgi:hypothetical protein